MKDRIEKIKKFISHDIWHIRQQDLPPIRSFFLRQLRILVLSGKGFFQNDIQIRATALTLYSVLAIVPVVAVAFGIAKGFGLEERLYEQLETFFKTENQHAVMDWVVTFSENMLNKARGGLIAGIGIIILFWSVIKVLGHIESSFNQIWQIRRGRNILRKFSDYVSFMMFAPLLFIMASGMNIAMRSIPSDSVLLGFFDKIIGFLLPYIFIWILLTIVYLLMPNTKVKFKSALIAGVFAGTIFQLVQWGYINFQGYISNYGVIYGSFAALPLFISWLQISWLIVLFGAEVSFANQNIEKYRFESESLNISHYYREILTLYIARLIIKGFIAGDKPKTASEISSELEIPVRIVRNIIYDLTESGVMSAIVTESEKDNAYQPAIDVNQMTIASVLDKVDKMGKDEIDVEKTDVLKKLSQIQDTFKEVIEKNTQNKLLKDI